MWILISLSCQDGQTLLREDWAPDDKKDAMTCLVKELMGIVAKMGGKEEKME